MAQNAQMASDLAGQPRPEHHRAAPYPATGPVDQASDQQFRVGYHPMWSRHVLQVLDDPAREHPRMTHGPSLPPGGPDHSRPTGPKGEVCGSFCAHQPLPLWKYHRSVGISLRAVDGPQTTIQDPRHAEHGDGNRNRMESAPGRKGHRPESQEVETLGKTRRSVRGRTAARPIPRGVGGSAAGTRVSRPEEQDRTVRPGQVPTDKTPTGPDTDRVRRRRRADGAAAREPGTEYRGPPAGPVPSGIGTAGRWA